MRPGTTAFVRSNRAAIRRQKATFGRPHIHLTVEGRFDCLVTQLYFAGEGENVTDRWLDAAPHPERLIVTLQDPPSHRGKHALVAHFDIVLANG
jgi:protocatechuate 3,4-dioxygenase beta subunit